ncbi:phage protease [Myxococcota bacterium]|nr:phage protease [Myxococcota bacterium]
MKTALFDITTAQTPCAAPVVEAGGELPDWIHIVPVGIFRGHPSGDFQVDGSVLAALLDNFQRDQIKLVLDLDHQTIRAPNNGMPAPAMGWFDQLEVRPDGLWAHVEMFTEKGAALLLAKEYRYISPVLCWWREDRVTGQMRGAWVHSVALCNRPWFASELVPPMAASDVDVRAIVATALAERDQQAAQAAQGSQVTVLVDQLVAEGRVTPAQRAQAVTLANANPDAFRAVFQQAPPVVPLQAVTRPQTSAPLNPAEAAVCAQLGLTPEQFHKFNNQTTGGQ